MKLLYVEDDVMDAELLQYAFARTVPDITIDWVTTCSEALARLGPCTPQTPVYDIVLTDIKLPDGSGLSLIPYIRERDLPLAVVVLTGAGGEESAVGALKSGANDFVVKKGDYLTRLSIILKNACHRFKNEIARFSRPLKVLYAERSSMDIDLTRRHMSQHAPYLQLEMVRTAEEVLQRLTIPLDPAKGIPGTYDMILLDYLLPGMNAIELLKELQETRRLDVPVVFITGQGDEEIALQAIRLGAMDYVVKNSGYLFHLPAVIENVCHRAQMIRAQKALKKSEEYYRSLIENVSDIIAEFTLDGAVWFLSPSIERILGYKSEEILGRKWVDLVHPDDLPKAREALDQIVSKPGDTLPTEIRVRHQDGSWLYMEVLSKGLVDESGHMTLIATLRDITERKQAEVALRQSEDKFRLAFQTSPDSVILTRLEDGLFVDMNQGFTYQTGFTREEVIGRTSLEINIWPEPADRKRLTESLRERGYIENLETQFRRKDGSLITCLQSARVLMFEEIPHVIFITRDISQRKRAEQALRESEEKYRNILENIEEGYYEVDLAGNFTFFNDPVCQMLGYSRDELLGMNNRQIADEKNSQELYRVFNEVYSTGKPVRSFEWQAIKKDGTGKFGEISVSLMKDAEGRPIGFRGIVRDVTNRKLAEQERQKLMAQLQQAQKMEAIGTLAGGIAHDFNNILTVIVGCTELALLGIPDQNPIHSHLMQVRQAGQRASELVAQILSFSRQGDRERKLVQPGIIVKEALKMLRSSLPSTIQIKQSLPKDQGLVMADPTHIHQILMNLCTNAAYAMREKGGLLKVTLSVESVGPEQKESYPDLSPGTYHKLTVSDTGPGMNPEIRERIFDPYFTTKPVGEGTGLGLAVVYGIVTGYQGTIKVRSEPGEGSLFEVFLPRVLQGESGPDSRQLDSIPSGGERILLVDDEEGLVYTMQKMLESLGYQVTARTNSREALETFQSRPHEFDLLITDMTMPHLTGEELSRNIKEIRSDLPVILCTGYSDRIDEEKAKTPGMDAFIKKPVMREVLAKTLRRVLEGKPED